MERAGSNRINDAAWWPEIELMMAQGWNAQQISTALNLSERRVRMIKKSGSTDGLSQSYTIFEPKKVEQLPEDIQAQLAFTADGFELFFNAYSGKVLPAHAKEWVEEFVVQPNLLLNVPPRHAKTTIFAVWVPLWLTARDRNEQIILVSKTARFARYQAAEIAYNLKYNKRLTDAFGRFAPENEKGDIPWRPSAGELMVVGRTRDAQSGQLTIFSVGAQGQILGREATTLIIDDVTDPGIARSESESEKEWWWLTEQVFNRLMPGGRACVIGQRVHYQDVYGKLADETYKRGPHKGEPLWTHIMHPAISRWPDDEEDPGEVLWPDLWDFDALMETYERMGDTAFQCMYQQDPLPPSASLVQPDWWEACYDVKRNGYVGYRSTDPAEAFVPVVRVISLDPSPTKFNGLVVADVPYQRDRFYAVVLEAKSWVGGLRSIIAELHRCVLQYKADYLIIEHSTFTGWLSEDPEFQELSQYVTLIGHNTGKNKGDPVLGVESLGGDIEFGRLSLPMGDEPGLRMSKALMDEANVWPHGKHDDILMALWFIKFNYKRLVPRRLLSNSMGRGGKGGWTFNRVLRRASV